MIEAILNLLGNLGRLLLAFFAYKAGQQTAVKDAEQATLTKAEDAHAIDKRLDATGDAELDQLRDKWTKR